MNQNIKRVSVLAHPFFSAFIYWPKDAPPQVDKDMDFMLDQWRGEVNRMAQKPNQLLVIVTPFFSGWLKQHRDSWFFERLQKFFVFSKKTLGKRLFVVHINIDPQELQQRIQGRGFRLDRKGLKGKAFGEWWGEECVAGQRSKLAQALKVQQRKIVMKGHLSMAQRGDESGGSQGWLGSHLKGRKKRSNRPKPRLHP